MLELKQHKNFNFKETLKLEIHFLKDKPVKDLSKYRQIIQHVIPK